MGGSMSSGAVTVTGSVTTTIASGASAPTKKPATITLKSGYTSTYTTAGTTLYTVTAGKTLYITEVSMSCNYGAPGNCMLILDGATEVFRTYAAPSGVHTFTWVFPYAIPITGGNAVKFANSVAGDGGTVGWFKGFEE